MTRRNKLLIKAPCAELLLTANGNAITLFATQIKTGHFNEHVTMEIDRADAVRLCLWLQEEIGKETQS